jgi:Fe-S-cluster containining protein
MDVPFPCKQCGKCCSMLQIETWTGISLFPWEKHLFPAEHVKPSLGLGIHPEHSDFKIFLYTYDANRCCHLKENICNIYTTRPLVCQSYPFRVKRQRDKNIYIVAPECSTIQSWPKKKTIKYHYDEMNFAELIGEHLSRFYKANESRWRFTFRKGWTFIGNK